MPVGGNGDVPPAWTGYPHMDLSHPIPRPSRTQLGGREEAAAAGGLDPAASHPVGSTDGRLCGRGPWAAPDALATGHQGGDTLAGGLFGGGYGRSVCGKSGMRVAPEAVTCQYSDSILSALNKAHSNCQRVPLTGVPARDSLEVSSCHLLPQSGH